MRFCAIPGPVFLTAKFYARSGDHTDFKTMLCRTGCSRVILSQNSINKKLFSPVLGYNADSAGDLRQ